jgi:hypothetical protein
MLKEAPRCKLEGEERVRQAFAMDDWPSYLLANMISFFRLSSRRWLPQQVSVQASTWSESWKEVVTAHVLSLSLSLSLSLCVDMTPLLCSFASFFHAHSCCCSLSSGESPVRPAAVSLSSSSGLSPLRINLLGTPNQPLVFVKQAEQNYVSSHSLSENE